MLREIITVSFIAVFSSSASAMGWYDNECCSEQDCRQTVLHEVERRDDGWFVSPKPDPNLQANPATLKFDPLLIPFDSPKVRRSLDPLIHICVRNNTVICIYVPEVPV